MAINFPSNPRLDDEHASSGVVWVCISSIASGGSYDAWGRQSTSGGSSSGGTMISIDMGIFPETENASIDAGSF